MTTPEVADEPLRVALVTSSYAYIADGVALTLNRLVDFLLKRGVEVLVFTPTVREPAFRAQGEVVSTPSAAMPLRPEYRLTFGLGGRARARLTAFAPDLIHVATPDFLGRAALAFGRRLGVPVVASYHTRYETYLAHYGFGALGATRRAPHRRLLPPCDEVFVPSESMADALAEDGGVGRVSLWARGVDRQRFDPAKRDPAWRAAHGVARTSRCCSSPAGSCGKSAWRP